MGSSGSVRPFFGLLAFIFFCLLVLATFTRRLLWDLFLNCHMAFAFLLVVASSIHTPANLAVWIVPLTVVIVDQIVRAVSNTSSCDINSIAASDGVTKLVLTPKKKTLLTKFEAGCFYFIQSKYAETANMHTVLYIHEYDGVLLQDCPSLCIL